MLTDANRQEMLTVVNREEVKTVSFGVNPANPTACNARHAILSTWAIPWHGVIV
jgi:hypothetical protein